MSKPGSKSQVSITAKIGNNDYLVTDFGMLVPIEKKDVLLAVLTYMQKITNISKTFNCLPTEYALN